MSTDFLPRAYAEISQCGTYRYTLGRRWSDDLSVGPAVFVMLNPSTADANQDDPTIRRCIGFAKALGCGGLHVVNLYAYRATKPADMFAATDPVGPRNDAILAATAIRARDEDRPLIAAWGANAKPDRVARWCRMTAPTPTHRADDDDRWYVRLGRALAGWGQDDAA